MSIPSTSPLLLADIPELHDLAVRAAGTIVVFTLDESVAPCPKCDSTKNWLDRKNIDYIEQPTTDRDAPVLQAIRAYLSLPEGTPVTFPIVFTHKGEYGWHDLNKYQMMALEKQLASAHTS